MPLRITKATDTIEVKNITACVYAVPGVGKTSLGFTADHPLLLDFDKGAYRSANRGDSVQVDTWADVTSITAEDLANYKTLVVDTAGRALDALTVDIIAGNPKMGRGGALTLQGFGELKSRFIAWTKLVRSFGLDVVLISHSDEQRSGDEIIERLDMQGGSKNEIYKAADVMGRLYIAAGKRVLNFNPTDTAFGKNPAQLSPLEVPNFAQKPHFFADVLAGIKDKLNEQSELQVKAAGLLADWKAKIEELKTAEDFTNLLPKTKEADVLVRENVQRVFAMAAKAKGFKWDKAANAFAAAEQKAA